MRVTNKKQRTCFSKKGEYIRKKYYSLLLNLFVWFRLGTEFKKIKKTFESCGFKLKICGMYQNVF